MRSGTSYFNSTLYRKTMARFWPLWAAYGLGWAFLLPLNLLSQFVGMQRFPSSAGRIEDWILDAAMDIPRLLQAGVLFSFVFGLLCAMAVFHYLYQNRSACAMHAMPLRRETLFTTQYLAGLSFAILPHLAVALCTAALEMALLPSGLWSQALPPLGIWLITQSATFLFFFSFASFCAMFTGHILALPAFYCILNGLAWGVYGLFDLVFSQFFYGFSLPSAPFLMLLLTPLGMLFEACEWSAPMIGDALTSGSDAWQLLSPQTVAGYAAAGLVLAVLALLFYRRRQVESAGDVISFPFVRPIFQWGVTFCTGLTFGAGTALFFSWFDNAAALSVSMILWSVVGFFAAEMLLKKSLRVTGAWKRALIAPVMMGLFCLVCFTDVLGIESRVPKVEQVKSLTAIMDLGEPYDSGQQIFLNEITDPEQIAYFLALHQSIVEHPDANDSRSPAFVPGDDYFDLTLFYTLDNGSRLERRYYTVPIHASDLEQSDSTAALYSSLLQDRDLVAYAYGFDKLDQARLIDVYLSKVELVDAEGGSETSEYYLEQATKQQLEQLWQAVQTDFAQGTIGLRYPITGQSRWDNTYVTDLYFRFDESSKTESNRADTETMPIRELSITLTPQAKNTLACLQEFGGLNREYHLIAHDEHTSDLPYTHWDSSVDGTEVTVPVF